VGNYYISLSRQNKEALFIIKKSMTSFTGEYECSVDSKGRVLFPAGLRRQLPPEAGEKFVINRGFEKHLNVYPYNVWKEITSEMMRKLNLFEKDSRIFFRKFYDGATELFLDGQGRILLPQRLMKYAGIKKDVIFYAYADRIELWSLQEFEKMRSDKSINTAALAEKVMGNKK
jgi:MraZ protein